MDSPGGDAEADVVRVSSSILEQNSNSVNMIHGAYFILLEASNRRGAAQAHFCFESSYFLTSIKWRQGQTGTMRVFNSWRTT